jgi:dienelactone hydrolase
LGILAGGLVLLGAIAIVPTAPARASAPARVVDGRVGDWEGVSPMVAGATAVDGGEFVHQDHIYDDTGAAGDRTAKQHSTTPEANAYGHFRYPADAERYADNAADLFQARLAVAGDRLWFLAWLNTLRQADTTVVSLALDVDGGEQRRSWPHQAGVTAAGADVVVTLWGNGGDVTDLRTGVVTSVTDVATSVDDNAIEAALPLALLGDVHAARIWVTTGLWDAASASYRAVPIGPPSANAPGNGTPLTASRVWNVGFRSDEGGAYQDQRQAMALRDGDVTPFSHPVDFDALAAGADAPWRPKPGRFYVAMLDTGLTIPPLREGVSYEGVRGRFEGIGGVHFAQEFIFLGRFQPYGLYLPSTWDAATRLPAALVMHGYGGSHSTYNRFPGFMDDFGEHPATVLITPLGRGSSFYADYGERDVLDVLDDVERRWSIDPDRLYLTGYSMGGHGVYRLGALYPDRFAGAVAWAGYTGEYTGVSSLVPGVLPQGTRDRTPTGDPVLNLESFLHLPLLHLTGTNDNVVPITGQLAATRRLEQLGYEHRLDVYPGYEHLAFGLVDEWAEPRAWLGDRRRSQAPRDVVLAVSEAWRDPALQPVLNLPPVSGWWVRSTQQREGRENFLTRGVVRATSRAIAEPQRTPTSTADVSPTPTPHTRTGVALTAGAPRPVENRLDLDLANLASVEVDLDRAKLTADGLVAELVSDGPTEVVLRSRSPLSGALVVTGPGASVAATPDRIVITTAAAGRWTITVVVPGPDVRGVTQSRTLAATGGAGPAAPAAVLLVLALVFRRLRVSYR